MDGLCREFLTREVLSPSETAFFTRTSPQDLLQKPPQEPSSHPRSLNDAFVFTGTSGPNGTITKHMTDLSSLLSKSLTDSGHYFARMEADSESPSRRYTKLEQDDFTYTQVVNPNDITKDRVRKKDTTSTSSRVNGIIQESLLDKNQSIDLDFRMDHDTFSTNQPSPFTMIDSDNGLYSRFADDDSNFTDSLSIPPVTSASFPNDSYTFEKSSRRLDTTFSLEGSASYRSDENGFSQNIYLDDNSTTPPITGGVHGTSDGAALDATYMPDVSSSSEVPDWQSSLDQGHVTADDSGAEGVSPMVGVEEDIKQEDDLFNTLTERGGAGGGSSLGASARSSHHQLVGQQDLQARHLGSILASPSTGGDSGGASIMASSSPSGAGGQYSPSTTALPSSELDYSDCGDDTTPLHHHTSHRHHHNRHHHSSPSPRVKLLTSRGGHHPPPDTPSSPPSPDRHYCSSTTSLAGDPSNTVEEDSTPRKTCLVCGDIASGFHYGVASCEACKAFFKRTIQGSIEYTCPANKDCEINKKRRKACQACRYQKCLSVGMMKEGVRLDRVRGGRQKYRRTSESAFNNSTMGGRRNLDDLKILSALRACEPETTNVSVSTEVSVEVNDLSLMGTLAYFYDKELVSTIGWAKLVPGFSDIVLEDQMRLLQSTWGEILTLGLAFRSMSSGGNTLNFATDLIIDENNARDLDALELFNQVLAVVERLEAINFHPDEYLVLKALVLTNSDVRLQDTTSLAQLRERLFQTLVQVLESTRMQDISKHLSSLLLCLPALRSADLALRKFWLNVRHHETVPMNKLFLEMLESQMR